MGSNLWRTCRVFVSAMSERRVPYWSAERLREAQNRRVRLMIRHAVHTVPFYGNAMLERKLKVDDFRTVEDLARLPLIDKAIVQRDASAFQSTAVSLQHCVALHSGSGTMTYWDPEAAFRRLPLAERDRVVWVKAIKAHFGVRQLFIIPPSSSSLETRRFFDQRAPVPRLFVERFYVDPTEPYANVIAQMENVRPDVVYSYGSYVEHFARYVRNARVPVRVPKVWIWGADTLSPHWRELFQREFGCTLLSNYASTEAGRMGFECEHQTGFHLNVDFAPLRIVRNDGSECLPGEMGEVVVSNLTNRATVLLNYRMGDLGEISHQPCPCGRTLPLLKRLHGRVSETVVLADGEELPSVALLGKLAMELEQALEVQVTSCAPGRILWRIVPSGHIDREAFRTRLTSRCDEAFAGRATSEVEYVTEIPRLPRGKFQTVIVTPEGRPDESFTAGPEGQPGSVR